MSADRAPSAAPETASGSASARYQPFAHLTAPNAELYRAVMGVFVAEKERFTVHLRPEDVHRLLPEDLHVDADDAAKALDRLADWGNLRPDPDTGRVTAVEDFYRRRYIYQLTRAGEAAEEALTAYDSALGRRGALQSVALADIAARLRELLGWTGPEAAAPDPALVHRALRDLAARFTELADNARAFMGSLQRTIDLHDAEVDAFLAYKDRLIDYLDRFIADLITTGSEIARLLAELERTGPSGARAVDPLLAAAADREAADTVPGDGQGADDAARRSALDDWYGRWDGLRGWFLSAPGHEPQAKLLRSAARSAIPQLLAVVAALNERRSGRSDRSADFRVLARWFAEAPDDDSRHRLWRAAFGLHPARHLTVDSETLQTREAEPETATTPWESARPVHISPQLRRTGQYERRGRPRKVADRSAERRRLAEHARQQADEVAAARARLDTGGEVRLSDVAELDPAAFRLFLGLLGDALAHWAYDAREASTTSNDGGLRIRLRALGDGRTAEIRTPDGVFRGPDHIVEITDLEGQAATR